MIDAWVQRFYSCDNRLCPQKERGKVQRWTVSNAFLLRCPICHATVTLERELTAREPLNDAEVP